MLYFIIALTVFIIIKLFFNRKIEPDFDNYNNDLIPKSVRYNLYDDTNPGIIYYEYERRGKDISGIDYIEK